MKFLALVAFSIVVFAASTPQKKTLAKSEHSKPELPILYEGTFPAQVHEKHYGKADERTLNYCMERVSEGDNTHQEFRQHVYVSGQPEVVGRAIDNIHNVQARQQLMKEHKLQEQKDSKEK